MGHNVHRARVAADLSQERVAYEANLSRYTYQKLEAGIARPGAAANPTLKTLATIAKVLDVDVRDLLPERLPELPEA